MSPERVAALEIYQGEGEKMYSSKLQRSPSENPPYKRSAYKAGKVCQ